MAWPNPFRHRDENTRTAWGYTFQLTNDHLTPEQIAPMKLSFDELGSEALKRLDTRSQAPQSQLRRTTSARFEERSRGERKKDPSEKVDNVTAPKRDLYSILRDNAQDDPLLGRLWTEAHTGPSWVKWDQVARGQDVFYRYGGPVLTGLAFQSLLGGMVSFVIHQDHNVSADKTCTRVRPGWLRYLHGRSDSPGLFYIMLELILFSK